MELVAALAAGLPVLLPTDTVYGLVSAPGEDAARALYELKGRDRAQPTALLAATIDALLETVPELDSGQLRTLLPGPYTLVVRNPAGRFPWLTGGERGPIGVRVPQLPEQTRAIVATQGVVLATSANDPGGPNPVTLDDVPRRIRVGCGAELDLGPLPGTPSTVIDLTHDEPRILREGAVPGTEALRRLRA
ncbi:MAG TPA: L-threonylcarbamoyladenylate synthase [Gaiellaceae bacterium]|nr:L-threonylcarbamoyladenylate synthase [Gaiellaceae bacterium]